MLNVIKELEVHYDIPTSSMSGAVQKVRSLVENSMLPCNTASQLILDLTGVMVTFDDPTKARITAQIVVESVLKERGILDNQEELVHQAVDRATRFREDPSHAWFYAAEVAQAKVENVQQVVEGVELKVAVTSEGKIKKGGKQVLAAELYKLHVLEADTALSNQEFIALLMKELQMSKAGATTYAYTVRKQLGDPEGGIVKSKKGRKAKEG